MGEQSTVSRLEQDTKTFEEVLRDQAYTFSMGPDISDYGQLVRVSEAAYVIARYLDGQRGVNAAPTQAPQTVNAVAYRPAAKPDDPPVLAPEDIGVLLHEATRNTRHAHGRAMAKAAHAIAEEAYERGRADRERELTAEWSTPKRARSAPAEGHDPVAAERDRTSVFTVRAAPGTQTSVTYPNTATVVMVSFGPEPPDGGPVMATVGVTPRK